ncbi:cbb3-type cytochrome c oxidase subunit 3 [uncultured Maritimibacter sp.]|jgi:cytochrome c oxidase cbb3-type subunit 4|uniref:cbb3-type cytochrome c oxidase subunit 3 n=1 Tax=uncultured Maritimibacter sp. TaxID=991866 RepID=UPI002634F623|nr:cbb3-type cytochrome c oxidase subunit 3 [uncultured Maritimibacter sp.]
MDTYSIFREIADSWVLLAMFLFFVLMVVWVFRPGSREIHKDAALAPFRNDQPAPRFEHGADN